MFRLLGLVTVLRCVGRKIGSVPEISDKRTEPAGPKTPDTLDGGPEIGATSGTQPPRSSRRLVLVGLSSKVTTTRVQPLGSQGRLSSRIERLLPT